MLLSAVNVNLPAGVQQRSDLLQDRISLFVHADEQSLDERAEIYAWLAGTPRQQDYKMKELRRAQRTRLIQRYGQDLAVTPTAYRRHRFPRRYIPDNSRS